MSTLARSVALAVAICGMASLAPRAHAQEAAPADAGETTDATDEEQRPGRSYPEQERRADDSAGSVGMEDDRVGDGPSIDPRPVPDYDGRAEPGPTALEVLAWIPRVLFYPVHLVLEWIVRRPLGWILTTGERERWSALQFPPISETQPLWGLVPTLFIDFGFQPSGGLYLWIDEVGSPRNAMRFQVGFGGLDWLRALVIDRYALDDHGTVIEAQVEGLMRPDHIYLGIGPEVESNEVARYGGRRLEGQLAFAMRPWRASHLRIEAGVRAQEFYDTGWLEEDEGELTVTDAVAQGWFALPPGWEGYVAYRQRLEGSIDTREPRPVNGSGVRLEGYVEQGFDLTSPHDRRWLLYGAMAGAYWDVSHGRTLALWGGAEFATALGDEPVPFTELPDLAVRGRMVGFRRGWLRGQSTAFATLEYRFPIWVSVDGFLNGAVGGAFGPELADFDAARLRMSYALGIRTVGDPDQSFTFQIGFGTDTFERGAEPAVLRITAGMQEGF